MNLALHCTAIRSPRGGRTTEIDWGDGHRSVYPHLILRGYCPCATCQGHSGMIQFVPNTDAQQELDDLESVGHYALRLRWFDGHSSGIFSYRYLRALCPCTLCVPVEAQGEHPAFPRM